MNNTTTIEQWIDKLSEIADERMSPWLCDNTEEVFEEISEVDDARGHIHDAIELLRSYIQ